MITRRDILRTAALASPFYAANSVFADSSKIQLLSPVTDCAWTCQDDAAILKEHGVHAVFRYIAELPQPETGLLSKQLTNAEVTALTNHGISIGTVYQYYSNQKDYDAYHRKNSSTKSRDGGRRFCRVNGERDARAAVKEAKELRQPQKSQIYFGVDGSFGSQQMSDVIGYFEGINSIIGSEFKVGVYGSGLTVSTLLQKKGLIHSNWVAKSPKWWGTQSFFNSGKCDLFQYAHMVVVPSFKTIKGVDCNIAFEPLSNFGFWGSSLPTLADADNADLAKRLRFIAGSSFTIQEKPTESSPTKLEINNDVDGVVTARTVKVLEDNGAWLKVLFSDEFEPKRFVTEIGYCKSDLLTPDYGKMPVF